MFRGHCRLSPSGAGAYFSIPCTVDTIHLFGVPQNSFPSSVDYFIKAMPQGYIPSFVDGHWFALYKLSQIAKELRAPGNYML